MSYARLSPEFEALWRDNDVRAYGDGAKHFCTIPLPGRSRWNIRPLPSIGRPDLGMVIYNPATQADAERIRSLVGPRR